MTCSTVIGMAAETIWPVVGVGVAGAMANHAILKPEIDSLLEALRVRPKEFLPSESDPVHPFLPKLNFSRGNAYEVIKGEKPLTQKMARKLRGRLQLILEWAIDDCEDLERIIAERARFERTAPADRERLLLMLAGAAIRERSAPPGIIQERRKLLSHTKAQRLTMGAVYIHSLVELVDGMIAERKDRGTRAEINERLFDLSRNRLALVVVNKGRFNIVDANTILTLFGNEESVQADAPPGNAILNVTWREPPESFPRERLLQFAEILRNHGFQVSEVGRVEEGCTTISITTTRRDAARILIAFQHGELAEAGVLAICEERSKAEHGQPDLESLASGHDSAKSVGNKALEAQLSRALRREALMRPWRRLRYLFSVSVANSPLWHTLAESDNRAYANPLVRTARNALRIDLQTTLLIWPALTALLLALLLFRLPAEVVILGVISGLALSIVGAQPCSLLISPLACGAGTIVTAFAFGIVHAMIFTQFKTSALFSDAQIGGHFFLAVNGGLIGVSASAWPHHFSPAIITGMISLIALAIFTSGWLMGQPHRARARARQWTIRQQSLGAVVGTLSGAGIGIVYALTTILSRWFSAVSACAAALAVVGAAWLGIATFLRFVELPARARRVRALSTALVYAVSVISLLEAATHVGSLAGCILLTASCGLFQSAFFTAAFVIALRIGGTRAALVATTLEGSAGFTIFIIARLIHG